MSYNIDQRDPSDLEKLTQNSLFDNYVVNQHLSYDMTNQAYTRLYDILYESEQILFEIFDKNLVQRISELPNLISKIILISFLLNTEFFFRMFPDSIDPSKFNNFIYFYFEASNAKAIIEPIVNSVLNNGDLTNHFIEFCKSDEIISSTIINIHLENLYNFPFNWSVNQYQLLIPHNFVDISKIGGFNQQIFQQITLMINSQPVAAGPSYNISSPIQYNNQQPITVNNMGGKRERSKKQRNKKHKSKNKKTRNKKFKKRTSKNKKNNKRTRK
jgi:hypothetical protein